MTDSNENACEKKMDRRTRKTLGSIRDAFIALLEEKPLDKITVTEIAKRADIDRKTFYLHYESIDSLVDELLTEEAEKRANALSEAVVVENGRIDILKLFHVLSAELVVDFQDRAAVVAHTDTDEILKRIEPIMVKTIVGKDPLLLAEHLGPYLDIFVASFCAGLLSLYRKWIESDSELPLEDLSAMAGAVMAGGIGSLVAASKQYVSGNNYGTDSNLHA